MKASTKKVGTTSVRCLSLGLALAAAFPVMAQSADQETAEPVRRLPRIDVSAEAPRPSYAREATIAGKEPLAPREIANSVSVISSQRIEDQGLQTVADALNQVTGVTVISNDTTQSQYLSRGYSLGVAYDGIPARGSLNGLQQFDLSMYEQVEVLRGPSGLFMGSNELGGVVNLVRKRALRNFAMSGSVSAGSWDNYRTDIDITGPLNEAGTLRARAVLSATDRHYFYDTTATRKWLAYGTLDWDITPSTTASLAVAVQDDDTTASYSGLPAWKTGELLDVSRRSNPLPDWNHQTWRTNDVVAELEHRLDNGWSFKGKLNRREQHQFFKEAFFWTGVDPVAQSLDYRRRVGDFDYTRDAVDIYASGPVPLFGRTHQALVGFNYERYRNEYERWGWQRPYDMEEGVPFGRPDLVSELNVDQYDQGGIEETTQRGLYGQMRLSLTDPLTVVLGGRLSWYNNKSRNVAPSQRTEWSQGARESSQFTPYAAVLFDLTNELTLYGSYSNIFVPQAQLRADGSVLDPREGRQIELGLKGEFLDGQLQASTAVYDLRDVNRSQSDGNGYALNAGEVSSKGWEFEIVGRPAPGYEVQLGYAYSRVKYLKDKNNEGLPFQTWEPKHSARLWGLRSFSEGALDGLTLGVGVNIASSSSAGSSDASAMRRQGGYAITNAMASYRLNRQVTVQFNANNLFDRTYYTRLGGTNSYNTYGAPRNFMLTLRAQY
ncbi:MAG: TonB-dependent siderophore receptor [Corticimicrobacter sp.]|uniref:TonB-dependent siderophore receptor n=1 Tax=Corticimicrobacter sp. TaxID=2678536 RepID=UPI0032DA285E